MLTLSTHRVDCFVFEQPLIISLNYAGGEILQLHRADKRYYVV